jgi:hypothetical protein
VGGEARGGIWLPGSHSLEKEETEKLKGAELVVVGSGTLTRARLSEPARDCAHQLHLNLATLPSHKSVERLNQPAEHAKGAGNAVHIIC